MTTQPLTDRDGNTVTITQDDQRDAYVISYTSGPDAGAEAGRAFYLDHNGERIFFHTEVDEAYGGRGLATVLARAAVTATRDAGIMISPVCPLIRGFLDKHADEFAGAFRKVTLDDLTAVKQRPRKDA